MIEIEKRAFISKEKYEELVKGFSIDMETTKQITYYLEGEKDFRIMFTPDKVKIWLKEGVIHDDFRKEYEVLVDKKYAEALIGMLHSLGYSEKIKWFRVRNECEFDDITLAIDYTHGYGYIIEGEIIANDDEDVNVATKKIEETFSKLGITVTEKEEFKKKYEDYVINWKEYTKDINENDFLKKEI